MSSAIPLRPISARFGKAVFALLTEVQEGMNPLVGDDLRERLHRIYSQMYDSLCELVEIAEEGGILMHNHAVGLQETLLQQLPEVPSR